MQVLTDEKDKLLDHEYDGIQELDNFLPPWWTTLFWITIVFAIVYFAGYELFGWFEQPKEEYLAELRSFGEDVVEVEIEEPENEIAKFLALKRQKRNEKEEEIVALTDSESLKKGKKIFARNCVLCHGKYGEGLIGPNLTDNYWLHGKGDLESIMNVVKTGVIEKGMQPWSKLGSKKILQVSSYILSLVGTTPEGAKEPEGVEYKEEPKEEQK